MPVNLKDIKWPDKTKYLYEQDPGWDAALEACQSAVKDADREIEKQNLEGRELFGIIQDWTEEYDLETSADMEMRLTKKIEERFSLKRGEK